MAQVEMVNAMCCSPSTEGSVRGAGELTGFDRTWNTYGMEAWIYVGDEGDKAEGFARPVRAP